MDTNPNVAEQVARAVRETVAEEIRERMQQEIRAQLNARRRPARLYAGAGAAGLYGGAALVAAVVLGLGMAVPMWASALIVAAGLLMGAVVLRRMARAEVLPGGASGVSGVAVAPGVEPGAPTVDVPGAPPVPGVAPEVRGR